MQRATVLDDGQRVRLLGTALHRSHTLWIYKGLYFCNTCGRVASTKSQQLLRKCPGFATTSGRATVSALMAGRKPWCKGVACHCAGHTEGLDSSLGLGLGRSQ